MAHANHNDPMEIDGLNEKTRALLQLAGCGSLEEVKKKFGEAHIELMLAVVECLEKQKEKAQVSISFPLVGDSQKGNTVCSEWSNTISGENRHPVLIKPSPLLFALNMPLAGKS